MPQDNRFKRDLIPMIQETRQQLRIAQIQKIQRRREQPGLSQEHPNPRIGHPDSPFLKE